MGMGRVSVTASGFVDPTDDGEAVMDGTPDFSSSSKMDQDQPAHPFGAEFGAPGGGAAERLIHEDDAAHLEHGSIRRRGRRRPGSGRISNCGWIILKRPVVRARRLRTRPWRSSEGLKSLP